MSEILTCALLITGGLFVLIAALGLLTMPDLFTRMQATSKSGTLGVGCVLLAVMVYFGELGVAAHALLVIAFLFLTAPLASHMIARAAYHIGVPRWEGQWIDELAEQRARATASESDGEEHSHSG